jgi:hypothetical protein
VLGIRGFPSLSCPQVGRAIDAATIISGRTVGRNGNQAKVDGVALAGTVNLGNLII